MSKRAGRFLVIQIVLCLPLPFLAGCGSDSSTIIDRTEHFQPTELEQSSREKANKEFEESIRKGL